MTSVSPEGYVLDVHLSNCFFFSKQEKITEVDLGMIPAHGLVPPPLHIKDIQCYELSDSKQHHSNAFSATRKSFQDLSLTPKVIS